MTATGPLLLIPWWLWILLIWELRARGQNKRESGAFLLGQVHGSTARIRRFICYDDLDPHALDTGIVTFDTSGYGELWRNCRELGLDVVADVHTHPSANTSMSSADKAHPMISQSGHIALIVPNFAKQLCWRFRGVSVNEYQGSRQWRHWKQEERHRRVRLSIW